MTKNKKQTNEETESNVNAIDNGGVTPEQIARWKAQYRKVYEITITDDCEIFSGYFVRPTMETLSAVAKLSKTDEIKGANVLFDNCWLGGSSLLKEEATLRMAALKHLNQVMQISKTEIKNM